MTLHTITWSPPPDPDFRPPWMLEVEGWDWATDRPRFALIPREMLNNYTSIEVHVPAGTILAFGRKRTVSRRHKSIPHFAVVLADGTTLEVPKDAIKRHFAGRV